MRVPKLRVPSLELSLEFRVSSFEFRVWISIFESGPRDQSHMSIDFFCSMHYPVANQNVIIVLIFFWMYWLLSTIKHM